MGEMIYREWVATNWTPPAMGRRRTTSPSITNS